MNNELDNKYCIAIRILHWISALMVFAIFCSGFVMSELDESNIILKKFLSHNHKSFGVILLVLVCFRLFIRLRTKTPSYGESMSNFIKKIAKLTHFLLYFFMIAAPISGIAMVLLRGKQLYVFGLEIPNFLPVNLDIAWIFYQSHKILPYLLIWLVGLHIAATLKHVFIDKDNVLNRITISLTKK
jgi:cytochrome b561